MKFFVFIATMIASFLVNPFVHAQNVEVVGEKVDYAAFEFDNVGNLVAYRIEYGSKYVRQRAEWGWRNLTVVYSDSTMVVVVPENVGDRDSYPEHFFEIPRPRVTLTMDGEVRGNTILQYFPSGLERIPDWGWSIHIGEGHSIHWIDGTELYLHQEGQEMQTHPATNLPKGWELKRIPTDFIWGK